MTLRVTVDGVVADRPLRYESRAGDVTVFFDVVSQDDYRGAQTGKVSHLFHSIRIVARDDLADFALARLEPGATVVITSGEIINYGPGSEGGRVVVVARELTIQGPTGT